MTTAAFVLALISLVEGAVAIGLATIACRRTRATQRRIRALERSLPVPTSRIGGEQITNVHILPKRAQQ